MPGRKYAAPSTGSGGYRYGFNGQEKSTEVGDDSYAAEYWQYDARLGRRWNIDPVPKENESPYATFGNNPIWNIDPNGADTMKYLSGAQIVDAIRIAYNVINTDIKNKKYNVGKDKSKELQNSIDAYFEQHKGMTFGAYAEFKETVEGYFKGLNEIAFAKVSAWEDLSKIMNVQIMSPQVRIRMVIQMANEYNGFGARVINAGANTAVGLGAGAIGTRAGPGPRGTQIKASNASQVKIQWDKKAAEQLASFNKKPDPYLDCSDIASDFNRSFEGGYIMNIAPKSGRWMTGMEYGVKTEFTYHQVYVKGNYVYDPMFSGTPINKTDFIKSYESMNPNGIIIK